MELIKISKHRQKLLSLQILLARLFMSQTDTQTSLTTMQMQYARWTRWKRLLLPAFHESLVFRLNRYARSGDGAIFMPITLIRNRSHLVLHAIFREEMKHGRDARALAHAITDQWLNFAASKNAWVQWKFRELCKRVSAVIHCFDMAVLAAACATAKIAIIENVHWINSIAGASFDVSYKSSAHTSLNESKKAIIVPWSTRWCARAHTHTRTHLMRA